MDGDSIADRMVEGQTARRDSKQTDGWIKIKLNLFHGGGLWFVFLSLDGLKMIFNRC